MTYPTMWVLSRGSYSDYRVLCVCPSKEEAIALRDRVNGSRTSWERVDVEELLLVDSAAQMVSVLTMSQVVGIKSGDLDGGPHERIDVLWPFDTVYPLRAVSWRWVRAPMYDGKAGRLKVRGYDHERVRRVFSDRLAAFRSDHALRVKTEREGAS